MSTIVSPAFVLVLPTVNKVRDRFLLQHCWQVGGSNGVPHWLQLKFLHASTGVSEPLSEQPFLISQWLEVDVPVVVVVPIFISMYLR